MAEIQPSIIEAAARAAYEKQVEIAGSLFGDALWPEWERIAEKHKRAWRATAQAVVDALGEVTTAGHLRHTAISDAGVVIRVDYA